MTTFNVHEQQLKELKNNLNKVKDKSSLSNLDEHSLKQSDLIQVKKAFLSLFLEETSQIIFESVWGTNKDNKLYNNSQDQKTKPEFKLIATKTNIKLFLNPSKNTGDIYDYQLNSGTLFYGKKKCDLKKTMQFLKRASQILTLVHQKKTKNSYEFN